MKLNLHTLLPTNDDTWTGSRGSGQLRTYLWPLLSHLWSKYDVTILNTFKMLFWLCEHLGNWVTLVCMFLLWWHRFLFKSLWFVCIFFKELRIAFQVVILLWKFVNSFLQVWRHCGYFGHNTYAENIWIAKFYQWLFLLTFKLLTVSMWATVPPLYLLPYCTRYANVCGGWVAGWLTNVILSNCMPITLAHEWIIITALLSEYSLSSHIETL